MKHRDICPSPKPAPHLTRFVSAAMLMVTLLSLLACSGTARHEQREDAISDLPAEQPSGNSLAKRSLSKNDAASDLRVWTAINPWDLVSGGAAQSGSAEGVEFARVKGFHRDGARPFTPPQTLRVTRELLADGSLQITRTPSTKARPMTATLTPLADGAVALTHTALSEGFTIESLPGQPIIWLPANLEALRLAPAPLIIRSKAKLTRDGTATENPYTLTIREIGNGWLPSTIKQSSDIVGIRWTLKLDAGPTILVEIDTWYRPREGILLDLRSIEAAIGPFNLFRENQSWMRADLFGPTSPAPSTPASPSANTSPP